MCARACVFRAPFAHEYSGHTHTKMEHPRVYAPHTMLSRAEAINNQQQKTSQGKAKHTYVTMHDSTRRHIIKSTGNVGTKGQPHNHGYVRPGFPKKFIQRTPFTVFQKQQRRHATRYRDHTHDSHYVPVVQLCKHGGFTLNVLPCHFTVAVGLLDGHELHGTARPVQALSSPYRCCHAGPKLFKAANLTTRKLSKVT